ncbi:unnamed protein product [Parnassius apollo]|uniref:(apollo) hypothetical protein n=1 Tax=Parnassius apollo TaxID=110799 RepID=A0A8S3WCE1_PARAO|nr:unnamed protein product [Parnassius apollo]
MNDEKLIILVSKYECLFDITKPSYSDRIMKDNAWEEISKCLGISEPGTPIPPPSTSSKRSDHSEVESLASTSGSKKRPRLSKDVATVFEEYLEEKRNTTPRDKALRNFFLSMSDTVETFPKEVQARIKRRVFNIVNEAELSLDVVVVDRALYLRRGYEEFKTAAVVVDEITSPHGLAHLGAFWSSLVKDAGDGAGAILISMAARTAARMLGRVDAGRSIRGFFASGATKPVFACAVARALIGRLDTTRLSRELGCVQEAEALVAMVGLWASREAPGLTISAEGEDERPATIEEERSRLGQLAGLPAEQAATEAERDAPGRRLELAVTALIANKPLASRAVDSRVCLVCLASHLCCEEDTLGSQEEAETSGLTFEEVRRAIVSRGGRSARAIAVAAAIHNREMHAANGNIHFATGVSDTRLDTVERLRSMTERGERYKWRPGRGVADALREAEGELPVMTVQTSLLGGSQSTAPPATQHCYLGRADVLIDDAGGEQPRAQRTGGSGGRNIRREGARRKAWPGAGCTGRRLRRHRLSG